MTWYFNLGIRPFENSISNIESIHYTLNYLIAGLIPTAALLLLHRPDTILYRLGLTHGFGRGILFGMLSTIPMLVGYAVIGSFNRETSPDHMFTFIVIAGFFEELIFRGFVFGELFRTAHWGFLPAAMLTALAFGSLHFYQGHDLTAADCNRIDRHLQETKVTTLSYFKENTDNQQTICIKNSFTYLFSH